MRHRLTLKVFPALAVLALLSQGASCPAGSPAEQVGSYGVRFTQTVEEAQKIVIASALPNDNKAKAMVVFDRIGQEIKRVGGALLVIDSASASSAEKATAAQTVTSGVAIMRNLLRSGLIPIAANDAAVTQVLTLFDNLDTLFGQLETSLAQLRAERS